MPTAVPRPLADSPVDFLARERGLPQLSHCQGVNPLHGRPGTGGGLLQAMSTGDKSRLHSSSRRPALECKRLFSPLEPNPMEPLAIRRRRSAGSASSLPSAPSGYMLFNIGGTNYASRPTRRANPASPPVTEYSGQTFCCTQIGCDPLVATRSSNTVALFRTFPATVKSSADMFGCCSASASRRVLTLWRCSTSRKIASIVMGTPLSPKNPKVGELQADWLRSEDLKEEKVVTTPWHYNTPTRDIKWELWAKGKPRNNRLKRHSPKSSRKWRSREWLCLQKSRVPFFQDEVLVVEHDAEK